MKEKIKKSEKGVTVLSLIVTIIVLLILSGITIKGITNDNGIISRAKETKNNYEKAEKAEEASKREIINTLKNHSHNRKQGNEIEILSYNSTTNLTNSKIELDWNLLAEIADVISEEGNINSDTSQVILSVNGKKETLTVGDYASLKYDGVDKKVRLIGFNHDDLANGNGKAGMTFEFLTTIENAVLDPENNIEKKGWKDWNLRTKMPGYLAKIQDTTRNYIKAVKKKYGVGINSASGIYSCTDSLWLLGIKEIEIENYEHGNDGTLYRYYAVGKINKTSFKDLYERYTKYDKNQDKSSGELQNSGDKWNHICYWLRSAGAPYNFSHSAIEKADWLDEGWRVNSNCYGNSSFYVAPAFCI